MRLKNWIGLLCLAFSLSVACGEVSADQIDQESIWGPLADMAGHDWVAVHAGKPTTAVHFRWDKPGQSIIVTGRNSTGGGFNGKYVLQSRTGEIQELNCRNGKIYRSAYKAVPRGFVEEGEQDGAQVRRIYHQVSATTFVSLNQSLVNGQWQTTRSDGTFVEASPEWVKGLNWPQRNDIPCTQDRANE